MTGPDTLFPGSLRAHYEAFASSIAAAGGAEEQFARTQVAYRVKRQFAWLTPVTRTRSLLTLDMYEPHEDPVVDEIIPFRADKFTHQITVDSAETITLVANRNWFELARAWGGKDGSSATR
ncbi:DUF5655 domain-containing protein [Brevibacterium sp. W7.2]|uniref:DUF5655 domain-containing protein n=1 Tax=Brevibacterium sp. W7.2 TaxID=2823518 RepID=UPI001BA85451|nr:DUF5655 domain-containing protein [Brevibacterium sp. W7.2]